MADGSVEEAWKKRLFVAVHAGAGFHSEDKASEYKKLCRKACLEAMAVLCKKESAVDAATAAVITLEDCELTNAGRGSSLTMTGSVECDASVMEGTQSLFGGVGCLSGVQNPIRVAQGLLQAQQQPTLSLGRIPPSILVGKGAREWAEQNGILCGNQDKLITDRSRRLHRKYKRKVEQIERDSGSKRNRFVNDSTPVFSMLESLSYQGNSRNDTSTGCVKLIDVGTHCDDLAADNTHGPETETELIDVGTNCEVLAADDALGPETETQHNSNTQKQHSTLATGHDMDSRQTDEEHDEEQRSNISPSHSPGGVAAAACDKDESTVQDTVGALCIDWKGCVSAAVSSGGIWLKQPGRLGPAAMYGTACWAQDPGETEPGVAVIASGCGEHLMRTLLAKTCADCLLSAQDSSEGLSLCIRKHFLESRLLNGVKNRLVGAVGIVTTPTPHGIPDVDLCWGHTTESMAVGYMTGYSAAPYTLISRLSEGCQAGLSFTLSGHFCHSASS